MVRAEGPALLRPDFIGGAPGCLGGCHLAVVTAQSPLSFSQVTGVGPEAGSWLPHTLR